MKTNKLRMIKTIALFLTAIMLLASTGLGTLKVEAASKSAKFLTLMECSVWSAPATVGANRVKKIPAGYPVTVYTNKVYYSTTGDGKTFYKTVKGSYILCKCLDVNGTSGKKTDTPTSKTETHTHNWTVEKHFLLNHTNEGHYAPYICSDCRRDFQRYEDLDAHQEETAIKSREAYRDENGVWHGEITHTGWCNGWVVEREWDVYSVQYKEVCACGATGKEWSTVEEVTCTCIHYGPNMHFHFADRECCRG